MWVRGVAVVVGLTWGFVPAAGADVFCKTKKGAVKVRAACKAKETQLNLADFGAAGPPGEDGADGQLRIFGDGSAGAKTVAASEDWTETNPQFTDVTIDAAATLTVPSGTVIRCTGTFTNNGMIVVNPGALGAFVTSNPLLLGDDIGGVNTQPEAGISLRGAQTGESGDGTAFRRAGAGGVGLAAAQARTILNPGPKAGGGGGAGGSDASLFTSNNTGNSGGGSLVLLCQGAVTNNGTITADGSDSIFGFGMSTFDAGGGGGGGGVVILASKTSVTNGATGVVNARGGPGQDSNTNEGPSGGGGGGIVHFLAPSVTAGTVAVTGGAAGATGAANSVTLSPRSGGGGGGASGGNGGAGGGVQADDTPRDANPGDDGFALTTTADPSALF